jgi:acyl-CoA synthetase (AMP-forming)/AMP-acid ligase II
MKDRRYDELCARHRWELPERYNIAADICDRHLREKPAMVHERYDGAVRDVAGGSCRTSQTRRQTCSPRAVSIVAAASRLCCRRRRRPPRSSSRPGSSVRCSCRCHNPSRRHEPSDELTEEIKAFVRDRLSAYAYPRRIELVGDLPKTLTGKIRRAELRQLEYGRVGPSSD